jgi:hypothetical protein
VVPFPQLSTDLASNRVPNYVWITPNLCHDMHDCAPDVGDQWLSQLVPSILSSMAWRHGGLLAIVSDEGTDNESPGGHPFAVVATPTLKPGLEIQRSLNHCGLLATIEDLWHLPRLGDAAQASSLAPLLSIYSRASRAAAYRDFSLLGGGLTTWLALATVFGLVSWSNPLVRSRFSLTIRPFGAPA